MRTRSVFRCENLQTLRLGWTKNECSDIDKPRRASTGKNTSRLHDPSFLHAGTGRPRSGGPRQRHDRRGSRWPILVNWRYGIWGDRWSEFLPGRKLRGNTLCSLLLLSPRCPSFPLLFPRCPIDLVVIYFISTIAAEKRKPYRVGDDRLIEYLWKKNLSDIFKNSNAIFTRPGRAAQLAGENY